MSQTSAAEQYPKELKIGYWNVGTVNGRISKIVDVMVRLKCDIAVCVDARRPGDEEGFTEDVLTRGHGWGVWLNGATMENKGFDMYWVGHDNSSDARSHGGFCIIFKPGLKEFVLENVNENSGSNTGGPSDTNASTPRNSGSNAGNPSDTNASTSRNNDAVEQITQGYNSLQITANYNQPELTEKKKKEEVKVLPLSINTSAGVLKLICCYWPVNADNDVTKIENELANGDANVSLVAILGEINAEFDANYIMKYKQDFPWAVIKSTDPSKKDFKERGNVFWDLCKEHNLKIASLLFKPAKRTWKNHFAIGKRGNPLDENMQLVGPNEEDAVCYKDEVTDERTAGNDFNNVCMASLNLTNAKTASNEKVE